MEDIFIYESRKITGPVRIDADRQKEVWKTADVIKIVNHMGLRPGFFPEIQISMAYDNGNIFLIFNIEDRFVRCLTSEINGQVWKDSCVEFFFSPDTDFPERYFNLEINCGGTPLMHYNIIPRKDTVTLDPSDISRIEIAHTLPKIVDPEIEVPISWTIEYRIPLLMLKKYSKISEPAPGIVWKANFFKIAENNSNPHYLTWAPVNNPVPDFHLPQYFGEVRFI